MNKNLVKNLYGIVWLKSLFISIISVSAGVLVIWLYFQLCEIVNGWVICKTPVKNSWNTLIIPLILLLSIILTVILNKEKKIQRSFLVIIFSGALVFIINYTVNYVQRERDYGKFGNDVDITPAEPTKQYRERPIEEMLKVLQRRRTIWINQMIGELLSSESKSIPKGTRFLGSKVEGRVEEKLTITLNFSEEFISQGEDFVYNESIPTIINTLVQKDRGSENAEFMFLIDGEPLEKALERRYKK